MNVCWRVCREPLQHTSAHTGRSITVNPRAPANNAARVCFPTGRCKRPSDPSAGLKASMAPRCKTKQKRSPLHCAKDSRRSYASSRGSHAQMQSTDSPPRYTCESRASAIPLGPWLSWANRDINPPGAFCAADAFRLRHERLTRSANGCKDNAVGLASLMPGSWICMPTWVDACLDMHGRCCVGTCAGECHRHHAHDYTRCRRPRLD